MPQILRQCGIERFMTQKLSWNQFTRPPHDSFRWRGIDGSEVLAHLPPVGTYNAELEPDELRRAVAAFRDHDRSDASLILFGHGDGGGGPTPEMLESAARVADLRGLPLVEQSTAERLLRRRSPSARDELATIAGQLYFEYHRGTYTSQAETKLGNRAGERALHEAEAAAAIAWARGLGRVPGRRARRACGRCCCATSSTTSSPAPRCARSTRPPRPSSARCATAAIGLRDRATAALAGAAPGDGAPLNLDGFERRDVLEAPSGGLAMYACPPFGFGAAAEPESEVRIERDGDLVRLDNGVLAAELDRCGRLLSLRLADGREALSGSAWTSSSTRTGRPRSTPGSSSPTTTRPAPSARRRSGWRWRSTDPLRAEIAFDRRVGEASELEQRVRLDAGSDRLEFRCRVDWRERHRILKAAFPLRVRAARATYGAQFGVHELSTHRNTDADLAHFEAPALGFADLGEHGFGVAVLSPTNHGFSAVDDALRLSLLRSPTDPDPEADQGEHELVFALLPHRGDWRDAGVARAATALGSPPVWVAGAAPGEPFAQRRLART